MLEEGHIGNAELLILTYTMLAARAILPFFALTVTAGQTAAWLLVLLSGGLATVVVWVLAREMGRYPGKGLPQLCEELAGPALGPLLNLVLLCYALARLAVVLRLFTETFITAILPNTPPSVVALAALGMALYAANAGLEPLARANLVLAPLTVLAFLAPLLFNLPEARVDWVVPFWGPGPLALASRAVEFIGFNGEFVFIFIHAYALRQAGALRRWAVAGLLLATLTMSLGVLLFLAVFGPESARLQGFPLYNLARLVYLGRFFQRTEAVFVLFWALTAMTFLGVILHAAAVVAAGALQVPYYRPLLWPLAILSFSLALVPRNLAEVMAWDYLSNQVTLVTAFLVPILVLGLGRLRHRGVVRHEG